MFQVKDIGLTFDENKINVIIINPNIEKDIEYDEKVHEYLEKQQKIIDLINSEAKQGIVHNMKSFSMKFQYTHKLLGKDFIYNDLDCIARTTQQIKFFNNPNDYGLKHDIKKRSPMYEAQTMLMCTETMRLKVRDNFLKIGPTHYRELVYGEFCSIE